MALEEVRFANGSLLGGSPYASFRENRLVDTSWLDRWLEWFAVVVGFGLFAVEEVRFANGLTPYPCPFPLSHEPSKRGKGPSGVLEFRTMGVG